MPVYSLPAALFTAITALSPEDHPEIVPSIEQNRNAGEDLSGSANSPAGTMFGSIYTVPVGEPVPVPLAGGMVTWKLIASPADVTTSSSPVPVVLIQKSGPIETPHGFTKLWLIVGASTAPFEIRLSCWYPFKAAGAASAA